MSAFTGYSYATGLAGLNAGIDSFAKAGEDAQKKQTLAALGQKLQSGDYAGASQLAFDAGDATTGFGILKLGQEKQQQDEATKAYGGWNSGATQPTPQTIGGLGQPIPAARPQTAPPLKLGSLGSGIPNAGVAPQQSLPTLGSPMQGPPVPAATSQPAPDTDQAAAAPIDQAPAAPIALAPTQTLSTAPVGAIDEPARTRLVAQRDAIKSTLDANPNMDPSVRARGIARLNTTLAQLGEPLVDVPQVSSPQSSQSPQAAAPVQAAQAPKTVASDASDGDSSSSTASGGDDAKKEALKASIKQGQLLLGLPGMSEGRKASINAQLSTMKDDLKELDKEKITTLKPSEYAANNIDPNYKGVVQKNVSGAITFPGKASTEVNISQKNDTSLDKAAIEDIVDSKKQAMGAVGTLKAIDRQTRALDSGMISGAGANFQTTARSFAAKILGIDDIPVTNSQAFDAAATQKGAELAKQIANAGHTTNMDLNVGQTIAGGDRAKTEAALRQIIDAQAQLAYDKIDEHNSHVKTFGELNPDNAKKAGYFSVKTPDGLKRPLATPKVDLSSVPSQALHALKANPALRDQFDAKYGKGASDAALSAQ